MNVLSTARGAARLAKAAVDLAAFGVPSIRGALFGARVGAGARFGSKVLERLGISVGESVAQAASGALPSLAVVRDGITVELAQSGSVNARVSHAAVAAARTATIGRAMANVGRATMQGAGAGAILDAAAASVNVVSRVRAGHLATSEATRIVLKHAIRGAVAGAAGVAAASGTSAVLAATGLGVLGAPVVIPLVVMVSASRLAMRAFDHRFGVE